MHVEDRDALERLQEAAKQGRKTRTWPRVQAVVLAYETGLVVADPRSR